MGFHYTLQYGRRTRIKVLNTVDIGGHIFEEWYERMHTYEELKKIADAGYNLLETHFLYGFGLKSEREEIERTKLFVENAHKAGIKVLGYFQFFSIQSETFFLDYPELQSMLQIDEYGKPYKYASTYDRNVLCFSYPEVQKYYLDGVELGLNYCDLDGIRLDNDYYKGCYCQRCLEQFREYLKETYSREKCKMVFGISSLEGVQFPSARNYICNDPLWMEMIKFRQIQRQKMIKLIRDKVKSTKEGAIFGGNPTIGRRSDQVSYVNIYIPDLGETHDLVCAENLLFPQSLRNSIRHQSEIYQHGNASGFKVYASHHHLNKNGSYRFPNDSNEVMLSLCEGLAFGGHCAASTWGMRLDNDGKSALYERPEYLNPQRDVAKFLEQHPGLYDNVKHASQAGIYYNRESITADFNHCWNSLQGLQQILLQNKIPFSFVYGEKPELLQNIDLLIVPDVRLMKNAELEALEKFLEGPKGGKIIFTGESCAHDEYFLKRKTGVLDNLKDNENALWLEDAPEKLDFKKGFDFRPNKWLLNTYYPPKAKKMVDAITKQLGLRKKLFTVKSKIFVTADIYKKDDIYFLHLLNYENNKKCNAEITWNGAYKNAEIFSPEKDVTVNINKKTKKIEVKNLKTYAVLKIGTEK